MEAINQSGKLATESACFGSAGDLVEYHGSIADLVVRGDITGFVQTISMMRTLIWEDESYRSGKIIERQNMSWKSS